MTVGETSGFRSGASFYVAMSKVIRGRLSEEQVGEGLNRRAVLLETRGLKGSPVILDTMLPCINWYRQVMHG